MLFRRCGHGNIVKYLDLSAYHSSSSLHHCQLWPGASNRISSFPPIPSRLKFSAIIIFESDGYLQTSYFGCQKLEESIMSKLQLRCNVDSPRVYYNKFIINIIHSTEKAEKMKRTPKEANQKCFYKIKTGLRPSSW